MRANLILMGVVLSLTLFVAEAVLRIFFPAPPLWKSPQIRHLESPLLGWIPPPSSNSYTINAPVAINSHGLRDNEFPAAKPLGETRILCLGDSFTFALGVRFEDLYVQRLEKLLNERHPSSSFQVINAGVSGYNTRQELIYLLTEGIRFDPDMIVVGFYWNDLVGNEPSLPDLQNTPRLASEVVVYETGERERRHTLPDWIRNRLRQSLVVYLSVIRSKQLWRMVAGSEDRYTQVQRATLNGNGDFLEPYLLHTKNRLLAIAEAAMQRSIPVILMVFPMEIQLKKRYPEYNLTEVIRMMWAETGMPFVALEPRFRASLEGGASPFLAYDLHPNAVGMEIAAQALYEVIAADYLLTIDSSTQLLGEAVSRKAVARGRSSGGGGGIR